MVNDGELDSKTNCLTFYISGEVTWKSVESIINKKTSEIKSLASKIKLSPISQPIKILVDLSEVTKVDMCALALILEIEKIIKISSKENVLFELNWLNVPSDLISLSDLCGLTEDLGFR